MLFIQVLFPFVAAEYAASVPEHIQKSFYDIFLHSKSRPSWTFSECRSCGALTPKVFDWLVDDYRKATVVRRNKMLFFAASFGKVIPVKFADVVMSDLESRRISP